MLTFMRWKPGAIPPAVGLFEQYQYFEPAKARWVDCDRAMYLWFLHRGVVWMNPSFDPVLALAEAA